MKKLWRFVSLQCESTYYWAVHFKMVTTVIFKKITLVRPKSGMVMYWKDTGLWIWAFHSSLGFATYLLEMRVVRWGQGNTRGGTGATDHRWPVRPPLLLLLIRVFQSQEGQWFNSAIKSIEVPLLEPPKNNYWTCFTIDSSCCHLHNSCSKPVDRLLGFGVFF